MLKVYEISHPDDEYEWIAANTAIEALSIYFKHNMVDVWDVLDSDIKELLPTKWDKIAIALDEDGEETETLTEYMTNNLTPDYIAGSMYQ